MNGPCLCGDPYCKRCFPGGPNPDEDGLTFCPDCSNELRNVGDASCRGVIVAEFYECARCELSFTYDVEADTLERD